MTATNSAEKALQTENDIVTLDRRRSDRRQDNGKAASTNSPAPARRKKPRRRHIDPTTCERDYSQDEIDFMRAMDDYKGRSGRMFPTCSEVLEVVRELGYVKLSEEQRASLPVGIVDGPSNDWEKSLAADDADEESFADDA